MASDVDQVAKALNVTPRRCQQLVKEGMPRIDRGSYDLGACMLWYIRYLQKAVEARADPEGKDSRNSLDVERSRLAREQGDRVALENAEKRGDLARISVIEKEFGDAVAVAQALLLSIPTKEAPMLAPITNANAIEHRLRTAINEALSQLAYYGKHGTVKRSSGGASRVPTVRATAHANGKRVVRSAPPTQ